ncbi:MAG: GyrI-like domain-containing protein [Anaerolineae bacterium]|nr:GyrI-like domain-containing protein [Anaerolineae bacterium]RIK18557.1 MAG: AraC family transcriptional regulator [Anaerolineae bacterium]
MTYQCEIREQPVQPALSIRARTPVHSLPQLIGETLGTIIAYLSSLGEGPTGPSFVAYHNLDMDDLDVEIGFPVSRTMPGKERVQASELPRGKVATCLFIGPYSEMAPAYDALTEWTRQQGYELIGTAYEFYLDDPAQTPPAELRTQIMFPLKP